jgi:hypothetical protein
METFKVVITKFGIFKRKQIEFAFVCAPLNIGKSLELEVIASQRFSGCCSKLVES